MKNFIRIQGYIARKENIRMAVKLKEDGIKVVFIDCSDGVFYYDTEKKRDKGFKRIYKMLNRRL